MVFAFALHLARQYKLLDDTHRGHLFSRPVAWFLSLAAALGVGVYTWLSFNCRNKSECNEIHPYIAFVPLVSFVALRNISGVVRTRYSAFFAWFGRISLEVRPRRRDAPARDCDSRGDA